MHPIASVVSTVASQSPWLYLAVGMFGFLAMVVGQLLNIRIAKAGGTSKVGFVFIMPGSIILVASLTFAINLAATLQSRA